MKKNVIALMLSFALAAGSIGTAPAFAAENGATAVESETEEAAEREEFLKDEQPEVDLTGEEPKALEDSEAESLDLSDQEETSGGETDEADDENDDLSNQYADDEMDSADQGDVQQDIDTEGVSEETAEKNAVSSEPAASEELQSEQTIADEMTTERIRAFQNRVKIWKIDNRITIVYDSTENAELEYGLYSGITNELLYTGNLEWNENSGLYYTAVDFDAVNEAIGQSIENNKINIKDIPVRVLLENNTDQDNDSVERFEEIVSQATGVVTIETDTRTEGQITVKWDSIDDEIDGYSVIVRGDDESDPLLVYDTARPADDVHDKYGILDVDHTSNDQITLNTADENICEITVAAYKHNDNTGAKYYGEATEYEIVEEEISESVTNKSKNGDAEYVVIEGRCGDSARFVLTGTSPDAETDLTMTITGTGVITQAIYNEFSEDYGTGYMAVGGEMVRKVIIEEGVTEIGPEFFKGYLALETVIIPHSVTSIDYEAFSECSSLASITIPDSVKSIGENAFYWCYKLKEIHISSLEAWLNIDDSYSRLSGDLYLNNTLLTSVVIPGGINSIRHNAFCGCSSLASVTIPKSVTSIGASAFYGCSSLTSITLPGNVTSIGECAFYGCESLTSMTIPDGVKSIGYSTFEGCHNLTSVTIPESVTSIGGSAFSYCFNLTNIVIPEGITSISGYTFTGCSSLANIVFPKALTNIGASAFSSCSKLTSITIPVSVTSIGEDAFSWCSGLKEIHISSLDAWLDIDDMRSELSGNLYLNNTLLTTAVIPDGRTNIRHNAFNGCNGLTNVTIPESVTSIGENAFKKCNNLTSMTIPNGVTFIGRAAFEGCGNLTSMTIPDGVTSIEDRTFCNCLNLVSVIIPDRVTFIGASVFNGCENLTNVTIPDGVTFIGESAFRGCRCFTNMTIPDGVTSIGASVFNGCKNLTNVTIPDGVTLIGSSAFEHCVSLKNIKIPDSVTIIEGHAFSSSGLVNADIPDGVTSIGYGAFSFCDSLTDVTIPDSVTNIYGCAFDGCKNLTHMTIPDGVTSIGDEAFYYCLNLESVTIPASVTSIGSLAFSRAIESYIPIEKLTIYGYRGTYAEEYANEYGIPFVDLDEMNGKDMKASGILRKGEDWTIYWECNYKESKQGEKSKAHLKINIEGSYEAECTIYLLKEGEGYEYPGPWIAETGLGKEDFLSITIEGSSAKPLGTIIGQFKDYSSLEEVTISYVDEIHANTFENCTHLTKINGFDKGLREIGNAAFKNTGLTAIELPVSLTGLGDYAFQSCESLTEVDALGSVESLGKGVFSGCTGLKQITIPDGVTKIGEKAFFCCDSLNKIMIPKSVISIGTLAFSSKEESYVPLESLTIYGYSGSKAEQHAKENGIPFKALDEMSWDNQGTYSPYKTIALQAASTGRYITCDVGSTDDKGRFEKMGKPDLNADATKIQWYEQFELVPCSDGRYALRSVVNRKYLSCKDGKIQCTADFIGTDEKLILTPGETGVIKFEKDRYWLRVEDGKLCLTGSFRRAEVFNQILVDDNRYTDDEIAVLAKDEWFNLYSRDMGGYYEIQKDVGEKTKYNAHTLRDLGYTIMNVEDQLGKRDYIEIYNMQCFVAYKLTNDFYDVIIAFQGTDGYDDIVADGQSNVHDGGYIGPDDMHQGYSAMADKLINNEINVYNPAKNITLKGLISFAQYGDVRFTILGHSMGGAIAQCYAIHLVKEGVPKCKIRGRTFNSALAINKDEDFDDWINLCVSSDSVTNGLVTGSILSYGIHRVGKTIWLYDNAPDLNEPDSFNISANKHVMNENACLYKILHSYWEANKCDHLWNAGKITVVPTEYSEGERLRTCTKCEQTKIEIVTSIKRATVSGLGSMLYTGNAVTPTPVVKIYDKSLEIGKDYKVSYKNNINVGTATVTITGKGNYYGTMTKTFKIISGVTSKVRLTNVASGIKVSWEKVEGAKYYKVYRGNTWFATTSKLEATDTGVKANNGIKYTYKVVATTTKNDSSGDSAKNRTSTGYRLIPVGIKTLTSPSAGKMTVTYDKNAKSSGYVVRYSLYSDMNDAKVITVSGADTVSRTFGGLTKGKTYYVQVRTYKFENGTRYYSGYCTTKSIKIKK